ncbi:MAG TPA: hypothetical protein VKJ65_00120 [Phycisphaerae bacterium]|nr:hypothetical protein [Phycisphaerae bacterium]
MWIEYCLDFEAAWVQVWFIFGIKPMKLIVLNLLVVCGTLQSCVGYSTVKPAAEQHSVAAIAAAPKPAHVRHDYPMSWFVRGWLAGESASPDFPEPGDNGSSAWLGLGVPLECLGYLLCHNQ